MLALTPTVRTSSLARRTSFAVSRSTPRLPARLAALPKDAGGDGAEPPAASQAAEQPAVRVSGGTSSDAPEAGRPKNFSAASSSGRAFSRAPCLSTLGFVSSPFGVPSSRFSRCWLCASTSSTSPASSHPFCPKSSRWACRWLRSTSTSSSLGLLSLPSFGGPAARLPARWNPCRAWRLRG